MTNKINFEFFIWLDLNQYLESALENKLPECIEQITGYECRENLCHIRPGKYSHLNIYEKESEYWCSFKWTLGIVREFVEISINISEPLLLTPALIKNQSIDYDDCIF